MTLPDMLLSIKQVAEITGKSDIIVRRWIERDMLPAIDLNAEAGSKKKSWMVHPDDLVAFFKSRRSVQAPAVAEAKPSRRPAAAPKQFI